MTIPGGEGDAREDMTVREPTAENLQRSEQDCRDLVNALPGAVYTFRIDARGRRSFTFISEGIRELAGLSAGDVMADAEVAFQRVPAEAMPALEQSIGASMRALSPWIHEFPIRTFSGEQRWLRGQSMPRSEADGATVWHGAFIDITARMRAELSLHDSEARFRAAFDQAAVGMARRDIDGLHLDVNQKLCDILGYTRDELLGLTSIDITLPAERPQAIEFNQRLRQGELSTDAREQQYLRKDGTPVWVNLSINVIHGPDGRPDHVIAAMEDVSQRKQAEEALRRVRAAMDMSGDSIYLVDRGSMRFVDVNQTACVRMGYSREELLRLGPQDLLAASREEIAREYDKVIAAGADGITAELSARTKDGRASVAELHRCALRLDESWLIVCVARDVTRRKLAEEALRDGEAQLRLLTENIPAAIAYFDRDQVIKGANQRYARLYSAAAAQVIGRNVRELVGETAWPEVARQNARALAGESVVYERTNERSGQGPREIEVHLEPDRSPDGKVRGVYAILIDITKRRRAERSLRDSEERFRSLTELSSDFFWEQDERFRYVERVGATHDRHGPYFLEAEIGRTRWELPSLNMTEADWARHRADLEAHREFRDLVIERPGDGGNSRFISISGRPVFDKDGRFRGYRGTGKDITESRLAEDNLRRFRAAIDVSADLVLLTDPARMRYIDVNDTACKTLGYGREEMLAMGPQDIFSAAREELAAIYGRLIAGDLREATTEGTYRRKDGSLLPVESFRRAVPYARRHAIVTVARDITERKRTESALRLLSAEMAHLSGEAFFNEVARRVAGYLDAEIGFVSKLRAPANERVRTLGLCVDGQLMPPVEYDLAGAPCESVIGREPVVLPDHAQQRFPACQMLVDLGVSGYAAVPLFDAHGKRFGALGVMSRKPLRQNADRIEALLRLFAVRTAAEIERLGAEARFKDLFEFSADACLIVNQAGIVTAVNRGAESLLGYSREELIGLPVDVLVPDHARARHAGMRRNFRASATPRPVRSGRADLHARRKDGTTLPVDIDLLPLQTDDGPVVVATVHDTSERKRAEAKRALLEAQLRQSQKMEAVGTLAGGIAHDFNNIIGSILGNAELARQDIAPEHPAGHSIAEIDKAGRRARALVQQILAFSRKQEFVREVVALGAVVDEAVRLLQATLPAGVRLAAECAAGLPNVSADPTQVHQVLVNLCTNAWHAMEGRPGSIDIHLAEVAVESALAREIAGLRPGRYVRLSVADTGKGMDAATKERIFEPFFTTKAIDQGTGLGLSVVHGIMQGHEGAIAVDSTPGAGTTFQLYFPAVDAPAAQRAAPAAAAAPKGRQQHVLYLDDDEALVSLVRRMLGRQGYRVSGYTLAPQALEAVRADPEAFDLVVTDYNMPGMSGLDVAHELSLIRPGLPVAVTSGYITDELRERAPHSGVRHLIYKPDTVDELCDVVRRLTEQAG
ncbi:MAG: PAS domain S-box protein [Burkholderiales bacterium]